jgi:alpha-glucuronidase
MIRVRLCPALVAIVLSLAASSAQGETGAAAWLRYAPLDPAARAEIGKALPATVVTLGDSPAIRSARDEIVRGLSSMLGRKMVSVDADGGAPGIVIGTRDRVFSSVAGVSVPELTRPGSFWLGRTSSNSVIVAGRDDRGVLYGAFALLRRVAIGDALHDLNEKQEPAAPLRWVNEWNNLDGTIERGYGGSSIFFEDDRVVKDLTRAREYARILASVGINAASVNNVNANPRVLTAEFIPDLVRLAEAFRPWGVGLAIAVDFSSPQRIGGLDTFDPLDPRVAAFWKSHADDIYRAIPDFAGFVLKADSEGRLGPSAYGRTHADAANVIARALAPHGGVIFYRGFVYDHHMDWQNPKNDRARAAYDNFRTLDGAFDDNVVLQIKHGPIDFQVREPASPLFGALEKTNQAIELQITQEYLGQQRHVCYLVPMWKEPLDFDMRVAGRATPVKQLVSGATFRRPLGGFVGVSNVGRDANWLGHDLAMANLYGFGRLAWNPDLGADAIADEWTRQTFGNGARTVQTIDSILMDSWPAYEGYSGPLGAGTLTDIIGVHFGPGVESSERNGWGQWHRADDRGIGMDRTSATGTGYIGQYAPAVAAMYESLERCPDALLLFMHHVAYTHVLKSGKTVIQHIYDSHYEGAAQAADFVTRWRSLESAIDRERFAAVLDRLEFQAGHAIVWRDAVVSWFLRASAIADAKGRAGRFPGRVEAETMVLDGYAPMKVTPWETASGGSAVTCGSGATCAATMTYDGAVGTYDLAVQYFDENDGASRFTVLVNGRPVDSWRANRDLPSPEANGHTATRHTLKGVRLAPGDAIRVEGTADGKEGADLDYVELSPARPAAGGR